jgi:hypothetical protein
MADAVVVRPIVPIGKNRRLRPGLLLRLSNSACDRDGQHGRQENFLYSAIHSSFLSSACRLLPNLRQTDPHQKTKRNLQIASAVMWWNIHDNLPVSRGSNRLPSDALMPDCQKVQALPEIEAIARRCCVKRGWAPRCRVTRCLKSGPEAEYAIRSIEIRLTESGKRLFPSSVFYPQCFVAHHYIFVRFPYLFVCLLRTCRHRNKPESMTL